MAKYIVKRLLLGLVTVLAITFVMFLFQQIVPDKPYTFLINRPNQTQAQRQAILDRFGADQPTSVQYLKFVKNMTMPAWNWVYTDRTARDLDCEHEDPCTSTIGAHLRVPRGPYLGDSIPQHGHVWESITVRFSATMQLMVTSFVITLLIAVPIGILSAVKQYSKLDNTVTSLSFIGISLPNYWFGTILIYVFAIFPVQHGYGEIFPVGRQHSNTGSGLLDLSWHLVLPVIVLAVQSIAQYARYIRASMLEVLGQDYIRTARAKGLAGNRVVIRHAFRNSLLPFITLLGLDIPTLFVGAVITEFVFDWPGMGQLFVASAGQNDFPILIGITLLLSVFVVLGNLIADLAYTWADPRISYG